MTDNPASLPGILATMAILLAVFLLLRAVLWPATRGLKRLSRRGHGPLRAVRDYIRAHPLGPRAQARFPRLFRFVAARLDAHTFVGLPLTLLACAAVYFAALFAGLIDEIYEVEELVIIDATIDRWVDRLRAPSALAVFAWITDMGSAPAMVGVGLVGAAFLLLERRLRLIPGLWAAVIGSQATTWIGKYVIARERPEFLDIASAESPSFPSGHATAAVAVYGFLAYALMRQLPSARSRFEIAYWTAVLVALIAASRIYLRVHFASDVAAGLLVGAFWLFVGIAVAEWPRRKPAAPD